MPDERDEAIRKMYEATIEFGKKTAQLGRDLQDLIDQFNQKMAKQQEEREAGKDQQR